LEKEVIASEVNNEEKEAIFAKSDIFVFPTYYDNETFGLVNLEAMQAKLPIISTPEGGIPDMVEEGENGFIVSQKDAEALADKLEELIKDPQKRKEMGQKGYEKYQRAFTLQVFEERFTDILKKIIAN
jgi:glycosyltransferase involved in cell wall biosynthesis